MSTIFLLLPILIFIIILLVFLFIKKRKIFIVISILIFGGILSIISFIIYDNLKGENEIKNYLEKKYDKDYIILSKERVLNENGDNYVTLIGYFKEEEEVIFESVYDYRTKDVDTKYEKFKNNYEYYLQYKKDIDGILGKNYSRFAYISNNTIWANFSMLGNETENCKKIYNLYRYLQEKFIEVNVSIYFVDNLSGINLKTTISGYPNEELTPFYNFSTIWDPNNIPAFYNICVYETKTQ